MDQQPKQIKLLDIGFYTAAAQQHGQDSDPDHEVGDLQDMLRAMWAILTPAQRVAYAGSDAVRMVLQGALPNFDEDASQLLAELPKLVNEAMENRWDAPLNLFTTTLKERIAEDGPTLVKLRDGSLELIAYRAAQPDLDEDESFVNISDTLRWRLNGVSVRTAELDMIAMG